MSSSSPLSGWRRVSLTAGFVLLAVALLMPRHDVSGQTAVVKLTTALADLAGSIPQETGPTIQQRTGQAAPLPLDALPRSARDAIHTRRMRIDENNDVQVYILVQDVTSASLQQLRANGVTIEITDAARRRVQARIPITRLHAVAALPFVTFIRLPTYAVRRTGSKTTEGDAILRADAARGQFSLDGTGVKVGVISDGLKGVFASRCTTCGGVSGGPIATGDLPSATGTRSTSGVLLSSSGGIVGRSFQANGDLEGLPPPTPTCGFAGAGAEGTALLEVVHDVAPGAQLSFANADTDLAFNQAVNFMASTNDVVMDDLGFYGTAYDGTSSISSNTSATLNNPANRIRAYVTAVGNAADEHYIGSYLDSGVDGTTIGGITTAGRLHQFQQTSDTTDVLALGPRPYNVISLPTSGEVVIFLTWDDPFGGSANNYDLYLVRQSTGLVVARSTDVQSGAQDPVEAIDYVNTGATDYFRIVVQNVNNAALPKDLNIFSFEPECAVDGPRLLVANHHERHNYNTATRSIGTEGDASGGVISVGAICSASAAAVAAFSGSAAPDESCLDSSNSTIEFFSSRGPTLDGRTKPDISGIDGVSVTGAGSFGAPFFGSSAATPHVAGIGALLLQAAPCLAASASGAADPATARGTLRSLIVDHAVGLGDPNTFGSGRADALASVQATLPVFSGSGTLTVPGNTTTGASLSASQLGFADPSQCALTKLSWTGGCGTSPATSLNCPFGTTTVNVSASNNGVTFSSPVAVQITVTDFGLNVAPGSATVNAGQSAVYQVTVSAQGGTFPAPVTFGCTNLPPLASCSFNPPTVVLGTSSVQSTLTISTVAPAAAATSSSRRAAMWPRSPWSAAVGLLAAALALSLWSRRLAIGDPVFRALHRFAIVSAVSVAGTVVLFQLACSPSSSSSPASPPPSVALSPAALTFATQVTQTTSAAQTVTLTNSGKATLTIAAVSVNGDFGQANTCGASVAAGASCTISVTFAPTSAGQRTGGLTIVDNAANNPQTVSLTGTGQTPNGTPSGSYQVNITGAAGTLTRSISATLVVR